MRSIVVVLLVVAVTIGLGWFVATRRSPSESTPPVDGTGSDDHADIVPATDLFGAEQAFRSHYGREPDRIDTYSWLAEDYVRAGELEKAAACFAEIPDEHPRYGHAARFQEGQVLLRLNRARAAEKALRTFLRLERDDPQRPPGDLVAALRLLADTCGVQLRLEDQRLLLHLLTAARAARVHETLVWLFPTQHRWSGPAAFERLRAMREQDPEDLLLRLAEVQYLIAAGELDAAEQLVNACESEQPGDLRIVAARLELLDERGNDDAIRAVVRDLPPPRDREPWAILRHRARAALDAGDLDLARRMLDTLLVAVPTDRTAHALLADLYTARGEPDLAADVRSRSNVLARIANRLPRAERHDADADEIVGVASLCLEGGFVEEAEALVDLARREFPDDPSVDDLEAEIAPGRGAS